MTKEERDESRFDWADYVPLLVHPAKVAIVEVLDWVGRPLSPTDMTKLFDDRRGYYLSLVSYHVEGLVSVGVIERVGTRKVRGAEENFYALRSRR